MGNFNLALLLMNLVHFFSHNKISIFDFNILFNFLRQFLFKFSLC
jgi:hypothetical protein